MQELKVIGIEEGALLVASDEGARYRVAVDDQLQSRLRQSSPDLGAQRKLSPREIQTHIRAGMSAQDVAAITGAPLDYVQRFEGPVLAEREFVIESALNVPVHTAMEIDPLSGGATFGGVLRRRLVDAGALNERWASWKEEGGSWIVKLTFVAEQIEHDARWSFDPKKQALAPLNQEAVSLSQQGELPQNLVPRLRAVEDEVETSRFDSGAFQPVAADQQETGPLLEPVIHGRIGAQDPADDAPPRKTTHQTADLLEALRRRRGERDPMDPEHEQSLAGHPETGAVKLIDVPLEGPGEGPIGSAGTPSAGSTGTGPQGISRGGRKNRTAMPSWDEIVFGARTDDD
ncbi:MAG TPA: septation protein SepH [Pseudolysinimonas sp.]|nr:septation protein SepH [Pseudolysinimonas sp.]